MGSTALLGRQHIVPLCLLLPPLVVLAGLLTGGGEWSWLLNSDAGQTVLWQVRFPRVVMAFLIGAALSAGGVLIQGVVRNPLADPGLIGVSGGAAVGAAVYLVFASSLSLSMWGQPLAAFIGGAVALLVVMQLGLRGASIHAMSFLILAGISVNVLASALIGLMSYMATDSALRQITFWSLGSLSGANWRWNSALFAALVAAIVFWRPRLRTLDALLLGEVEARSMGISVVRMQWLAVLWVALLVGIAVCASGVIGFVGLISPHIARLLTGATHKRVLPLAIIFGGCLVVLADMAARTLVAPAELPIGIVTTLLGAPVFISLLLREKRRMS